MNLSYIHIYSVTGQICLKFFKFKGASLRCINPHLNKALVIRSLPGLLCVYADHPGLSGQDPGHGVVTEPGLALHHQNIARPG